MAEENENKRECSWSSDSVLCLVCLRRRAMSPERQRLLELAGIGRPSVTPHYIRLILLSSLDESPAVVFG